MTATLPTTLSRISQQGLIENHRRMSQIVQQQWPIRDYMQSIDIAYLRNQDLTEEEIKARIANVYGDTNKLRNVTIPVIKPQIKSAVGYQSAIFISDFPMFGVVAPPQYADAALQMQALIEENSIRGAWARELILFFYDGFKYNMSLLEASWKKIVTTTLETDVSFKGGKEGKPKQTIWAGNCLHRWDPYNSYWDTRCSPFEVPSKGEICGHTELFSKTALKALVASLDTKLLDNITSAFESPSMLGQADAGMWGASYFIPRLNSASLVDVPRMMAMDWDSWAGLTPTQNRRRSGKESPIHYRGLYEVSTEYVRILPSDFDIRIPSPNTPQIYKLIIVNHSVIIHAELQTNAHEKIPVFFGCPTEDGLMYQSASLAEDGKPFQEVASTLMNSVLATRRKAVGDRIFYDQLRIDPNHINNANPASKIPVKVGMNGKPISDALYVVPFRDDQAAIAMQEIQAVVAFSNVLNGQNPVRQGQFVKGNKTDGQWESTMTNATTSDQLTALILECQVFTPVKEVLKLNYLQYQGGTSIYSPSRAQSVTVDPLQLREAVINFKFTDGILPKEKIISSETRKVALQVIGSSPQLAGVYNLAPLFSYIMKTENCDLSMFEKTPNQVAYEQALGSWQAIAQIAMEKGMPFSIPQPIPAAYGYKPEMQDPALAAQMSGAQA